MRNRIVLLGAAALVTAGLGFAVSAQQKPAATGAKVVVYKSPT